MPVLPSTWSLESLLAYCWGVEAGLLANDDTASLAPKWVAHIGLVRKGRDARDDARQKTARAEARTRVFDARFDSQIVFFSGTAYLAAGKDAKAEPYHSLFGTVSAKDAIGLGAGKATIFGSQIIATATHLAHASLMALIAPFKLIVEKLGAAGDERRAAAQAEKLHDIDRERLVEATEHLAAETEIALLKIFLGQAGAKDLVRSILAVPRSALAKAGEEVPPEAPAPA
jgi:hypothetical protein